MAGHEGCLPVFLGKTRLVRRVVPSAPRQQYGFNSLKPLTHDFRGLRTVRLRFDSNGRRQANLGAHLNSSHVADPEKRLGHCFSNWIAYSPGKPGLGLECVLTIRPSTKMFIAPSVYGTATRTRMPTG